MELRTLLIDAGILALVFVGLYFGYRLLRLGNVLLGLEWIILGFSASNMFLFFNGLNEASGAIAMLCDAFSRSVGIPVIGLLGLMKLTHGYTPSLRAEVILFVGGFLLAAVFVDSVAFAQELPVFYLLLGVAWSLFLFYFAYRLSQLGLWPYALAVGFGNICTFLVAMLEGIITIPGEETNLILNFYFIAHWVWALNFGVLYFAYKAMSEHYSVSR